MRFGKPLAVINALLLLGLLITSAPSLAQTEGRYVTITGKLTDATNGEPIPFAHVLIEGFASGSTSNLAGEFDLKIRRESLQGDFWLKISCIGYRSQRIPFQSLDPKKRLDIALEPATSQLNEVVIRSKKGWYHDVAREIVREALDRIPQNFPRNDYLMKAFYRHYCKENGKYGRLIEAAVDLLDTKGYRKHHLQPADKMETRVTQLRRSFDFTQKADFYHTPISIDFVQIFDITAYHYRNPFLDSFNDLSFEWVNTTSIDDRPVYVVQFSQLQNFARQDIVRHEGTLYIDAQNAAFLRVTTETTTNRSNLMDSLYTRIEKVATYRSYEGKYYINQLISDGVEYHAFYDSLGNLVRSQDHEAHVEMIINEVKTEDFEPFKGREPSQRELNRMEYDSTFWEGYSILKATPLEEKIVEDLAARTPLENQFRTVNVVETGGESLLESERFQAAIEPYKGTVTYLVLWASWGLPAYYNFIPTRWFERMCRKGKVNYVWLCLNQSEEEWLYARKYHRLNQPHALHRQIPWNIPREQAETYFSEVFPIFLVLDKAGKIADYQPHYPTEPIIKEALKGLLKE